MSDVRYCVVPHLSLGECQFVCNEKMGIVCGAPCLYRKNGKHLCYLHWNKKGEINGNEDF